MRKKMVWRYWCDFCGKGGCSAGHMAAHEKHCTLNPQRECRVCKHVRPRGTRINLSELVEMAKRETPTEAEAKALADELMDEAYQCPMCVYAAIRQADRLHDEHTESGPVDPVWGPKIEVSRHAIPFDLKAEMASFWKAANEDAAGEENYRCDSPSLPRSC